MKISFIKEVNANKDNRVEFWLNEFDYIDGSDLLAKLFCEKYKMESDEKLDGIHFSIIKLHSIAGDYELLWHEDMGNIVYSIEQDEESIRILEQRLGEVIVKLNSMINN